MQCASKFLNVNTIKESTSGNREATLNMKFISGWTWYCEFHDSFGVGISEIEVQHMAQSHKDFYQNSGNPCQMFYKNQDAPENLTAVDNSNTEQVIKKSTYMSKVKESFTRAWQKWDVAEDELLRRNFDERKDLQELCKIHQRASGGIVARLRKLDLLEAEIDVVLAEKLLENNHEKLIKRKIYSGTLKTVESKEKLKRIERGKESFSEYGTVNPPPVPLPNLKHTSLFNCSICEQPIVGNSCHCRNN
jgi:hypothetical protein